MTMAKKKKVLPNAEQQNLLFNTTIYNSAREIANTMSESIKHCKKLSREQITSLISELIDMKVTVTILNQYASEQHHHVMPTDLIKAFCFNTGLNELKRELLTDYEVLAIGKDKEYLTLAKKMSFSGTVERW